MQSMFYVLTKLQNGSLAEDYIHARSVEHAEHMARIEAERQNMKIKSVEATRLH